MDDLTDACIFLMENSPADSLLNIGTGEDITIRDLARLVMEVVGGSGDMVFDPAKPDGAPRKLLDVSRLRKLGWQAQTPLRQGIFKSCVACQAAP